jgi:hypothetical protein
LLFTRKENRPERPAYEGSPRGPRKVALEPRGRRAFQAGFRTGSPESGRRGGKAPFISRASARTLLIIPLLTLLIISFHPLSSPAQAAGEVAPSFQWPARGEVTRPFSASSGPYGAGGHAGIDIALASGSDVRASAPGTVSFAGGTPVGPCVSIMHGGGFKTTYVSLGSLAVRRGQEVKSGQLVGSSDGSKDRSSASPHLHFGMFLNGVAVDPLPFLHGLLLDPGECLFLGPWEDQKAIDAYVSHHGEGGFFDCLGDGLSWVGRTLGDGFEAAGSAVGRALNTAWGWVRSAGHAVGEAFSALYREYIAPWLVPLCRGALEVAKAVISNRFAQAILAGLAAALVVCLAVAGIALLFGLSLLTAVIAAVVGSIAAIAYSVYYAFTAGDSFSFAGCFLASLSVGGAAAATCLLVSYLAPVIGAGWSSLGWLGFGKAFLVHACADSIVYIAFCLATGRKVSPVGVLASFLIGGLTGGAGKLVTAGFSHGTAQALAAGWLSSGGVLITRQGAASISSYALAVTVRFSHKAAYALFCGCAGFLGDVIVRAAGGGRPSITESLLCFGGGALVGVLNLAGRGEGLVGLISRMSGGRLRISSDLVKALVGKSLSKGVKEGSSYLLRWLGRRGRRSRESLWQLKIGGEI